MNKLLLAILLCMSAAISAQTLTLPGFSKSLKGEIFPYHSPQPDADTALLVRSEAKELSIEWETAVVPSDHAAAFVDFNIMMALDVNPEDPHKWNIVVNDRNLCSVSTPMDTLAEQFGSKNSDGSGITFKSSRIDKYGDYIGYMQIRVPSKWLTKGEPAHIKIEGESAGSRTWLIVYAYEMKPHYTIEAENAIRKGIQGNERLVKFEIINYEKDAFAEIRLGSQTQKIKLGFGYNRSFMGITSQEKEEELSYSIKINENKLGNGILKLKPVTSMTIHLLHHSHVDIGYTHVQSEVEQKQWSYIEQCIELGMTTQNNPPEARFKWNIEVMWALDSYWDKASQEQKKKLKEAIQKGWIELDALYANELTALCSSEELFHLTKSARRIALECGVEVKSAMISDVPGWTWGIVPVLAQSGVRYLSCGTNTFHRIGYTIEEWGDKPFYWKSASGTDSVLTWIHAKGYSSFHTGLGAENLVNKLEEEILLSYMNELRDSDYPYDDVILRYNIGSDNGPPDATLTEKVLAWNELYISPKLVIATTTEAFELFEQKYGKSLPTVSGDFTAYWEDGAASSAYETQLTRNSTHTLNQRQALSLITVYPLEKDKVDALWKNILLYNEHTWGSWNSISEPESDFTKQQWKVKQNFAYKPARELTLDLKIAPLDSRDYKKRKYIEVFNTNSWTVRGPVSFSTSPKAFNIADTLSNAVVNESGDTIICQNNGVELHFISDSIPPLSSVKYRLLHLKDLKSTPHYSNYVMENGLFKIKINPKNRSIESLFWKKQDKELVNQDDEFEFNNLLHIKGRNPDSLYTYEGIKPPIIDDGNVYTQMLIESTNDKIGNRSTHIKVYHEIEQIEIINYINKNKEYNQEAIHFAFPFEIPRGVFHYDLAYGVAEIEKDQIKGSNRNFITIENWVDISNNDFGITWVSHAAPLIQAGDIYNDPTVVGFKRTLDSTQTIISYVMNNYWETNYLAAQENPVLFKYTIVPHQEYDAAQAERKALESQRPLIAYPANKQRNTFDFQYGIKNTNILIVSMQKENKEESYTMRFFNAGQTDEIIRWQTEPKAVYQLDAAGIKNERLGSRIMLKGMQTIELIIAY